MLYHRAPYRQLRELDNAKPLVVGNTDLELKKT